MLPIGAFPVLASFVVVAAVKGPIFNFDQNNEVGQKGEFLIS